LSRTTVRLLSTLGTAGLLLLGWFLIVTESPPLPAVPARLERPAPHASDSIRFEALPVPPVEAPVPLLEAATLPGVTALDLARRRLADEEFTGIAGTITASGRAVRRVRVTATWPGHLRSVWTDVDGRFVLRHVPPGEVTLTASPGHEAPALHHETVVREGQVTSVRLRLETTELCGSLVAAADTPLDGLSVWLFDEAHRRVAWATTDDDGAFLFQYLAPGRYRARVNGWRHHAEHDPVVLPTWSAPIVVSARGRVPEVSVHVESGMSAFATVLAPDGAPAGRKTEVWIVRMEAGVGLQGESIALDTNGRLTSLPQPYERVAWTDKDGQVAFRGLAPGDYAMLADPDSTEHVSRVGVRVRVAEGESEQRVMLGAAR